MAEYSTLTNKRPFISEDTIPKPNPDNYENPVKNQDVRPIPSRQPDRHMQHEQIIHEPMRDLNYPIQMDRKNDTFYLILAIAILQIATLAIVYNIRKT